MANNRKNREIFKYGICLNENCTKAKTKEIQKIPLRKEFVCAECGKELMECNPPKKHNNKIILLLIIAVIALCGIIAGVIYGVNAYQQKKAAATLEEIVALEEESEEVTVTPEEAIDNLHKYADSQVATLDPSQREYVDSVLNAEFARMQAEFDAKSLANDSLQKARIDSIILVRLAEIEAQKAAEAKTAKSSQSASKPTGHIDYGKWSGSWSNGKPSGSGTMTYNKEKLIDSRDPQKRVAQKGDYIIGEFYDGKLVQGRWYDSSNNLKGSIIIGR